MKNYYPFLITLICLFYTGLLSGQTFIKQNYSRSPCTKTKVLPSNDGGYFVSGSFRLDYNDRRDLIKFDNKGEFSWTTATHPTQTIPISMLQLDNDRLFVGGTNNIASDSVNFYITELDENGQELWFKEVGDPTEKQFISGLINTSDNNLLLYGQIRLPGNISTGVIYKLDYNGDIIWDYTCPVPTNSPYNQFHLSFLHENESGQYFFSGTSFKTGIQFGLIENDGTLIWNHTYDFVPQHPDSTGGKFEIPSQIIPLTDGYLILGSPSTLVSSLGRRDYFLVKLDLNGEILFKTILPDTFLKASKVTLNSNGNILVSGYALPFYNSNLFLREYDQSGNLLWEEDYFIDNNIHTVEKIFTYPDHYKIFTSPLETETDRIDIIKTNLDGQLISITKNIIPGDDVSTHDIQQTSDNGFIATGSSEVIKFADSCVHEYNCYLAKFDENGDIFYNEVGGQVFIDDSLDCTLYPDSPPFENLMVVASGEQDFYSISDSLGRYFMEIDSGYYSLSVQAPNDYWATCDSLDLDFTLDNDSILHDIGLYPIVDCPFLEVDIGTPYLRRCFPNTYEVKYCNTGTTAADNVYIEVAFDDFTVVNSASIPIVSQVGNLYTFDIGQVAFGDCDHFSIYTSLDCDSTVLGQTHCAEARIYPDTFCILPDSLWSGASIAVDADCLGDSVLFQIENVGTSTTASPLRYVIIVDDVILLVDSFILEAQEVLEISQLAAGATLRMEVEQEAGHPGNSTPSVTVEGCASNSDSIRIGFVSQFGQDDGDPFIAVHCQANKGSYDPNDKQGFPLGVGEEHLISASQEIDYLIRFQNTGTDTAFRVSIIDSLPLTLDPRSIKLGASSHSYQFNISGNGILQFDFPDILLPDMMTDLEASTGFIKFRIAQKPNNLPGTLIQNRAAIYFDFNDPVLTEYAVHTIEKPKRLGVSKLDWCAGEEFEGQVIKQDTFITSIYSFPLYDSLVTTYFSVLENSYTQIDTSIYSNEAYDGIFYTADTSLVVVLEKANGCDSIITTNLYVTLNTSTESPKFFQKLSISPNPSQHTFNLQHQNIKRSTTTHIQVFNPLGSIIFETSWKENTGVNQFQIDAGDWASGVYLISLSNEYEKLIRKVIKN